MTAGAGDRPPTTSTRVPVPQAGVCIDADLTVPVDARGVVVFAHGSGSSRRSPRNQLVADHLQGRGLATVLADLLTPGEAERDRRDGALRFDIPLLAGRVTALVDWAAAGPGPGPGQPVGLFGASTGAAAALVAAAQRPDEVRAVVSRGGRPDLAGHAVLTQVRAATLLIVGEHDRSVVTVNERAAAVLAAPRQIHTVPGATHLFEEPGALPEVADHAARWFLAHLAPARAR